MGKFNAINVEELKQLRADNQLTQIDMALLCDVSLSSFRLWERGVGSPNGNNITKLNIALDKLRKKAGK